MGHLLKQIRCRKRKMIGLFVLIGLAVSLAVPLLIYKVSLRHNSVRQDWQTVRAWGLVIMVSVLIYILIIIIGIERYDRTKDLLKQLSAAELERCTRQTRNVHFYKEMLTITECFAIVNQNGYTLSLIPIKDIKELRLRSRYLSRRVIPLPEIVLQSGKSLNFPGIHIKDPEGFIRKKQAELEFYQREIGSINR